MCEGEGGWLPCSSSYDQDIRGSHQKGWNSQLHQIIICHSSSSNQPTDQGRQQPPIMSILEYLQQPSQWRAGSVQAEMDKSAVRKVVQRMRKGINSEPETRMESTFRSLRPTRNTDSDER
uniref:Uncharacterized protein n=1 Tax=Ditylenchus dipsaci TaxID=166011 RepID=A0A915CY10_9BILA